MKKSSLAPRYSENGEVYVLPTQTCPVCHNKTNVHEKVAMIGTDRTTIAPGDICICGFCASVLTYDNELRLREVPQEELAHAPNALKDVIDNAVNVVKASLN